MSQDHMSQDKEVEDSRRNDITIRVEDSKL